ncbi:O-antigen ligase family protein [Gottfriedia acidiceleris]|uniref:O-antigen ligase family protein n=1 Tax=Gottfriedia acidiceleris TaxID=371036 RepID=UPI003D1FF617
MFLFITLLSIYFFFKSKTKELFTLFLILIISIPNKVEIKQFLFIQLGRVDTSFIPLYLLIIHRLLYIVLTKKKVVFNRELLIIFFFSILFIVILVKGILNNNSASFILGEGILYFNLLIVFISIMVLKNKLIMEEIIFIFNKSVIIYSILVITLQLFGKSLLSVLYNGQFDGRVTFNNTTAIVLTVIMSIYLLKNKMDMLLSLSSIILGTCAIFISQSRSLIVVYLFLIGVILLELTSLKVSKRMFYKRILIVMSSIFTFIIIGIMLWNSNFELINRLKYRFFSEGNLTINMREVTNQQVLTLIQKKPFGYGLGKGLDLYHPQGFVVSTGWYVDNIFYTFGAKAGIFGILILVILTVIVFLKIFNAFKKSNGNHKSFLFMLLVVSPIYYYYISWINAQILYAYPVFVTVLIVYKIFISPTNNKNLKGSSTY